MSQPSLTQTRLRELFDYNPDTGVFTRHKSTTVRGSTVGGVGVTYHRIGVDNNRYLTHRAIWLWVHGVWPKGEIDHINGDPTDNRLSNLRDVSPSENQHNKKRSIINISGHPGVSWNSRTSKWVAQICVAGKRKFLGRFELPAQAAAAYQAAKRIHHPTAPQS